ncbi:MAG: hypothetical protein WBM00_04400 [Solirubrobacterales bacterium]
MAGGPERETDENGFKARAGALTLLYLASPIERSFLLTMLAEAATGVELIDDSDLPDPDEPIDLEILADPYLVEPTDPDFEPSDEIDWDTELRATPAGEELLVVAPVLERWLNDCPLGRVTLGPDAGPPLSALLGGWCSTTMHALAAGPLTVAEAVEAIGTLGDEVVEERLEDMVEVGQLELLRGEDGEERFAVTDWLRMAIAPLAIAARMEHRHPPGDTAPIAALDVEAAFLLTLPLLELPPDLSGTCSLAVELDEDVVPNPAGVTVQVEAGRIAYVEAGLDEDADSWASAPAPDLLDTLIEPETKRVSTGGGRLSRRLLDELHTVLFGASTVP